MNMFKMGRTKFKKL